MAEWELNYEDREAIRKVIVPRCAQTVRKYALYLLGLTAPTAPQVVELPDNPSPEEQQAYDTYVSQLATYTAAHALYTARIGWAREAMRNVFGLGEQLSHYVTSDVAFVQGGSSISDAALTGVIEAAINTHFIVVS